MTVLPVDSQPSPKSQAPDAPRLAYARTWSRNANYRHGRWCRYRHRLEWRLEQAYRRLRSYLSEAPRYAPHRQSGDWPRLPAGLLARRLWKTAGRFIRTVKIASAYLRDYRRLQADGIENPASQLVLPYAIAFYKARGPDP